ncbi:MAG: GNAT family N-acetyltransferase [Actinomadura sp.]
MTEPASPVFALLVDGAQVAIRPLRSDDTEAVRELHQSMSPENLYLRFFGFGSHMANELAERLCRPAGSDYGALGAWLGRELVGVANYEPTGAEGVAEIALVVAGDMHHRGVGTLLLEHLASCALRRGIRAFRGDTLAQNTAMLRVFTDAGLRVEQHISAGVIEVTMPLHPDDRYLDAVAERERHADVESLEALFRPGVVAVVGVSRRSASVGQAILRNICSGGFGGAVYAVNRHGGPRIAGVPCVHSVADLPERPDLAVVTVPAAAVPQVARECGRRRVKALIVITSGLTGDDGRDLLAVCHEYGMRLVGPNCLGIANPGQGLNATFVAHHPDGGGAGVVVQSGGVGIALLEHLSRLGIGVSSFASVGDKYDVSSNDMLLWWESDAATRLGVVHVESFGNPRKFARTARRVGRRIPLLTVIAGRSPAGQQAAASHTAAAATPAVTRQALFHQAGIIATRNLGELVDVAALLGHQPAPRGPRVAIVSNAGGAGVLTADACVDTGLAVPELSGRTREQLAEVLPANAVCANPVDTTAAVDPAVFQRSLDIVAADSGVDAVLAVIAPTALSDLAAAAGRTAKPTAAIILDQGETVTIRSGGLPSYAFPEDAARAFAHAWSYGRWRARPPGTLPRHADLRPEEAGAIVVDFLDRHPDGGWLAPVEAMQLLSCYGVPLVPWRWACSEDGTVRAAAELRGPSGKVALKADVLALVHKTEAGALRLGVRGEDEVRHAYRRFAGHFGARLRGVVVQQMAEDGVEVLCGITQEPVFGPLVVFGLGGVATDVFGDRDARLTPLTDLDAAELVRAIRSAPLLLGHRGHPPVDMNALEDVLTRLSRLADDRSEIAELDLNPVIARPDGVLAVDARVHVKPQPQWDPYLRRLR